MATTTAITAPEWISFASDPAIDEVTQASSRLAVYLQQCDESRLSRPEVLLEATRQVREMKLHELLVAGDGHQFSPEVLLFHVADLLGGANLTAAWQGLMGLPAAMALTLSRHEVNGELPLAFPLGESQNGWLLLMPLPFYDRSARVWLLDGGNLVGPVEIPAGAPRTGLLGFPHGGITRIDLMNARTLPTVTLAASTHRRLLSSSCVLMTGLLSGALRRMVKEAYAYARNRKSAGKSIDLHQAVALRLGDLALNQQGLALYLQAMVEQPEHVGCEEGTHQINVDYITECAGQIAKDAVQIAAAHGYVEGLPFKRLFEQSRALACCIDLMADSGRVPVLS